MMCLGNLADVITVEGRGFTNDLVADVSACQFRSSDGQLSSEKSLLIRFLSFVRGRDIGWHPYMYTSVEG